MAEHLGLTVLVTGACGRQGGAVLRKLLDRGYRARGLTRDAGSADAEELRRLGAEVRAGSFDDGEALRRAMRGADAAFLMSTPSEAGAAAELRQACALIDAAKDESVPHVVLSSIVGANRASGVPSFESKRRIEAYLGASSVPFTVVRPSYFMDNALGPEPRLSVRGGVFELPLSPSMRLPQLALSDFATFVVRVMEHRRAFLGRFVDLASDEVTGPEMARAISLAAGRRVEFRQAKDGRSAGLGEEYATLLRRLDETGPFVDVAALRRDFPEIGWHSVEEWAWEQDWPLEGA